MKEPKFKVGEWCFCEFTLKQVMETEDDRITSVSDGYIRHGSTDLSDRCYPLEMNVKRISGEFEWWSKKFHELKNNSLNHPDLNRELIDRWCKACDDRDDNEKIKKHYSSLAKFGEAIISRVNELQNDVIEGVKLFR
jgi:hypothetical protein